MNAIVEIDLKKDELSDVFIDVLNSREFYFQKALDAFAVFKEFQAPKEFFERALDEFQKAYDLKAGKNFLEHIQIISDEKIKEFLKICGKLIAHCDLHASNKNELNDYSDKRTLARVGVYQNNWIESLINYKTGKNIAKSVKNVLDFLQDPSKKLTIFSEQMKVSAAKYLFDFDFQEDAQLIDALNKQFSPLLSGIQCDVNKTHLLSMLTYHPKVRKLWDLNIKGLIASDGNDWKESVISTLQSHETSILWWSKRPTGTVETIKQLKTQIETDGYFYFYYTRNGAVLYRARIIDLAEENEYAQKEWQDAAGYEDNFANYDDGKRTARIVFLTDEMVKLDGSLSPDDFIYWGDKHPPTQDNAQPFIGIRKADITVQSEKPSQPQNEKQGVNMQLNTILYGPPGTGKTYNSITKALSILEDTPEAELKKESRDELIKRYKKAVEEKRIEFVTFHQSFSYEDFVEGIKPVLINDEECDDDESISNGEIQYTLASGVFKRICKRATSHTVTSKSFDEVWGKFYKEISSKNDVVFTSVTSEIGLIKDGTNLDILRLRFKKSYDPTAPEGKKIFWVSKVVMKKLYDAGIELSNDPTEDRKKIMEIVGSGRVTLYYAVYKNLYSHIIDLNAFDKSTKPIPYILIIDEINRGNISKIFGELITLIEPDKRIGEKNEILVQLPYSGKDSEPFGVPSNLYIIGTMNTADRSIALMDTALRRRFTFEEMVPDCELPELDREIDGIHLGKLLKVINERVEYLYDRDHTIGHAYFIGVNNKNEIDSVMRNKVIPLLQEYFYDDWEKIQLVLGDHPDQDAKDDDKFIINIPVTPQKLFGSKVDVDSRGSSEMKYMVQSCKDGFSTQAYLKICNTVTESESDDKE